MKSLNCRYGDLVDACGKKGHNSSQCLRGSVYLLERRLRRRRRPWQSFLVELQKLAEHAQELVGVVA
jgi:hypothetical protein